MKKEWMVFAVVALSCCGTCARADVLIDFGFSGSSNFTNQTADGRFWNQMSSGEARSTLRDSNNGVSSLSVSTVAAGANVWNAGITPPAGLEGGLFSFETVTRDGLYTTPGGTGVIVISNLNVSARYDITLYGFRTGSERYTTYTETTVGGEGRSVEIQTGPVAPESAVVLSGLSADPDGVISFEFYGSASSGGANDTFGYLNAMRVVPEPATVGLIALSGVGVILARRLFSF